MQRYVRMFGTPITLLVLLGILFFGARWGYKNVITPAPPAPLIPCTQQSVGKALTPQHVSVKIFNGGTKVGLATTVATKMKAAGFKVVKTGNTEVEVSSTQIIGADVNNPEVKLVAGFFKGAEVKADGRADHSVEVLVGNKDTGWNEKAPAAIAVDTPTVCLPAPIATPTP